jgi:hypothetical protein
MKIKALVVLIGTAVGSTAAVAQNALSNQCLSPEQLDCTPTLNCEQLHDDRECNKCLVSFFGACQLRGNDPACEAAKASRNGAYAAEKAQCEAQKASQKSQCEAAFEALKTVAAACKQQN